MTDTITLRKLAEAANKTPEERSNLPTKEFYVAYQAKLKFEDTIKPAIVIALLDEIDSLRAALAQQAEQAGWVRVPVEPTPEMLNALHLGIWKHINDSVIERLAEGFKAMLAAAPKGGV